MNSTPVAGLSAWPTTLPSLSIMTSLVDNDLDDPHLCVLRLPAQKFDGLRHGNALLPHAGRIAAPEDARHDQPRGRRAHACRSAACS